MFAVICGAYVGLLLIAIAGLVRALRGRKIDDHPSCQKCGFDLRGKPINSARCPECGANILTPGSVRRGHWQRDSRRAWRFGGAILGLLLLGAGMAWLSLQDINLNPRKPVGLLHWQLTSGTVRMRRSAYTELNRRIIARALDADTVEGIVNDLLERQADFDAPWDPVWGDFVIDARLLTQLRDPLWSKFLDQAPVAQVRTRDRVIDGEGIPVIVETLFRLGTGRVGPFTIYSRTHISVRNATTEQFIEPQLSYPNIATARRESHTVALPRQNMRTVGFKMPVDLFVEVTCLGFDPDRPDNNPVPDPNRSQRGSSSHRVILVPFGEAIVTPTRKFPAESLMACIRIDDFRTAHIPNDIAHTDANLTLTVIMPPTGLAYEVLLCQPGESDDHLGAFAAPAGESAQFKFRGTLSTRPLAGTYLKLLPSPPDARNHADITEYADIPLTFENLPHVPPP